MRYCKHCKQTFDIPCRRKWGGHVVHCNSNPNKIKRIEKMSQTLKQTATGKASTPEKEEARKKKISSSMKGNPKAGGLREGSGRGLKTWYESSIAGKVYLRSTYELEYAKWLDENNIKWIANKEAFIYEYEGKNKKYYPDFYLIEENCYIEIKGFKTKQDEAKWANFPANLKILYGSDLINLGLKIKK